MKKKTVVFQAIIKQSSKGAIKIDAEQEAEITFTVSAIELANMLPVLSWGTEILRIAIMPEDRAGDNDENILQW